MKRRGKIALGVGLGVVAGLAFAWNWLPWDYDLSPRPVPEPNPLRDPDEARLFRKGTRVLVVTAHPDDAEFYLGGTLARLRDAGAEFRLLVATDGDKAYYGPFTNAAENRRVRRAEQTAAAAAWGAPTPVYLGLSDGRLRADETLVAAIEREVEAFRPDYVAAFDPLYPPRRSHSDHRRAGEATAAALDRARAKPVRLLFSTRAANWAFDVTERWDDKTRLMRLHASQFVASRTDLGNRLFGRGGDPWPFIERLVRGFATEDGRLRGFGLGEGVRVAGR